MVLIFSAFFASSAKIAKKSRLQGSQKYIPPLDQIATFEMEIRSMGSMGKM